MGWRLYCIAASHIVRPSVVKNEGAGMKLINTDGMALIGPGSEWFWTMLQLLVVAVSLLGLYRQLRLQASASAFEQLRSMISEWGSERLLRCRVELLRLLRGGTDLAKLPPGVVVIMLDYWETVGLLVRNQHVSRHLVWEQMGNVCELWWATLRPSILAARELEGDATIGENFAWLAAVMAELDRKVTTPPVYDEAYLTSSLDRRLASATDALQLVLSLRAPIEPTAV
jgi:hypothetical protein